MSYPSTLDRLLELRGTVSKIDVLERRQRFLVAALRANDESWETIGNNLGVTRQAAQQKFALSSKQLARTEQYHCECGWSIAYPMFEYSEAQDDIDEHNDAHEREATEYGPE